MGGLSRADNLLRNFAQPTSVCGILGVGDCPKMCKMMMIFAQNLTDSTTTMRLISKFKVPGFTTGD